MGAKSEGRAKSETEVSCFVYWFDSSSADSEVTTVTGREARVEVNDFSLGWVAFKTVLHAPT